MPLMGLGLEVLAYYGEGGEGEVALDDDGAEGEDQGGVADDLKNTLLHGS